MVHLGPEVCLTWAIMSVSVSASFLRGNWMLNEDYSLVLSVVGIFGIVRSSVASGGYHTRFLVCALADVGHSGMMGRDLDDSGLS